MAISLKLYRIFIPRQYNNGKPIEPEKLLKIASTITDKFGASSIRPATLPIMDGVWTSGKTKKRYIEPMMLLELFVEDTDDNYRWLKSFREIIRQELKQEEIFIMAQNAEIIRDY